MFDLKERTAVVTGGGGGIGLEIVRQLAQNGMNVVICSSRLEKGQEALNSLNPEFQKHCMATGCDVCNPEEVKTLYENVIKKFGSIDVIINGAGMHIKEHIDKLSEEDFEKCLGSNLIGTFVMIKQAIPFLEKGTNPRIINLSTTDGRTGGFENGVAMAAAKGGAISATRSIARDLASRGITVNCVALGVIEGDIPAHMESKDPETKEYLLKQIPLGRFGRPEDVAPLVVFLASEESRYITGATIDLNGGMFMG